MPLAFFSSSVAPHPSVHAPRPASLASIFLLLAAAMPAAAAVPDAVPVDGAPFQARLSAVDADWHLTFELPGAAAATQQMPAADLCWWGRWAEPSRPTQILLVDGTLIVVADVIKIDKTSAELDWASGGIVQVPLEMIAGIVFHPPADPQSADALLAKLSSAGGNDDRLLLLNGDAIGGELLSLADDTAHLRAAASGASAGELKVRTDKISAIAMNSALAAKPHKEKARAWLGLADGSRLLVSSLQFDKAGAGHARRGSKARASRRRYSRAAAVGRPRGVSLRLEAGELPIHSVSGFEMAVEGRSQRARHAAPRRRPALSKGPGHAQRLAIDLRSRPTVSRWLPRRRSTTKPPATAAPSSASTPTTAAAIGN